jgi:hypothetical protein
MFLGLCGDSVDQHNEWRLRNAATLVKLLVLAPIHREQVMDLIWPDLGRAAASNNLGPSTMRQRGVSNAGNTAPERVNLDIPWSPLT